MVLSDTFSDMFFNCLLVDIPEWLKHNVHKSELILWPSWFPSLFGCPCLWHASSPSRLHPLIFNRSLIPTESNSKMFLESKPNSALGLDLFNSCLRHFSSFLNWDPCLQSRFHPEARGIPLKYILGHLTPCLQPFHGLPLPLTWNSNLKPGSVCSGFLRTV